MRAAEQFDTLGLDTTAIDAQIEVLIALRRPMNSTKRPDVTHTTYGERISECEVFENGAAIAKWGTTAARNEWLLGVLRTRVIQKEVAPDDGLQLGLSTSQEVTELDWDWSCSEDRVREAAVKRIRFQPQKAHHP